MLHSFTGATPHFVLEALGYFIGARIYWRASRGLPQPPGMDRVLILAAAIFGAFVGSKILHLLEHMPYLLAHTDDFSLWISGKSVLGAFLGGTWCVELVKRAVGWRHSTGDAWVPALAVGLMIGRLGCQVSGMWDLTYGVPTTLPWGWDYGDGVARHPVGIYEIVLIGLLLLGLQRRRFSVNGEKFALFMAGYCVLRLLVDFLKPPFSPEPMLLPVARYGGMTAIQWAGMIGGVYFWFTCRRQRLNSQQGA